MSLQARGVAAPAPQTHSGTCGLRAQPQPFLTGSPGPGFRWSLTPATCTILLPARPLTCSSHVPSPGRPPSSQAVLLSSQFSSLTRQGAAIPDPGSHVCLSCLPAAPAPTVKSSGLISTAKLCSLTLRPRPRHPYLPPCAVPVHTLIMLMVGPGNHWTGWGQ